MWSRNFLFDLSFDLIVMPTFTFSLVKSCAYSLFPCITTSCSQISLFWLTSYLIQKFLIHFKLKSLEMKKGDEKKERKDLEKYNYVVKKK